MQRTINLLIIATTGIGLLTVGALIWMGHQVTTPHSLTAIADRESTAEIATLNAKD